MTKIIVIGTYFGEWPVWFPAFLLSCAKNDRIEWLFVTDCEIPRVNYLNIRFVRMNLQQFNDLASEQLGFRVWKNAYSQVDIRPTYGLIFQEYTRDFDFWGHCDLDVVWGQIRSFLTEEVLQNHDIISCREGFLAGHLTLWRNKPEINVLFREVPGYRSLLSSSEHRNFDENIISTFLKTSAKTSTQNLRIFWPKQMVVWFDGQSSLNGWYWDNGKVFNPQRRENVYLHFQAAKKLVSSIDFKLGDEPAKFEFTRLGIRSQHLSLYGLLEKRFGGVADNVQFSRSIARASYCFRLLKKGAFVRDAYWAKKLAANSISEREVSYDRRSGLLFLKRLNIDVGRHYDYLLRSYYPAVRLVEEQNATFISDERGELVIDVAGIRAFIRSSEDILTLKELLLDRIYNPFLSAPAVILDIGMNDGLPSLYFASQANVVVVGYEPCKRPYDLALQNLALNPRLCDRIQAKHASISDSKFRTIAMYPPKKISHGKNSRPVDGGEGPRFEYEEIQIEDAADALDSIVSLYPEREIVIRMDLKHSEYFVDGLSEYQVLNRICSAGKLSLIDIIMVRWHDEKMRVDPLAIARQLSDNGFRVFTLSPDDPHHAMLYAVQRIPKKATPSSAQTDSHRVNHAPMPKETLA